MAIGTCGINYNLRLGDKVFGWASADRATVGVAAEGGDERNAGSWATMTALGNEVKVLAGEARGKTGLVIGKFGMSVLLHFEGDVLDLLAVGDTVQVKARGFGLELVGVEDHDPSPDAGALEKFAVLREDGKSKRPWSRRSRPRSVGSGAGGGSLTATGTSRRVFRPTSRPTAWTSCASGISSS
jgi:hypothetical protein